MSVPVCEMLAPWTHKRKDIQFCVCGFWTLTKNISFLSAPSFLLILNESKSQNNQDVHRKGCYKNKPILICPFNEWV